MLLDDGYDKYAIKERFYTGVTTQYEPFLGTLWEGMHFTVLSLNYVEHE